MVPYVWTCEMFWRAGYRPVDSYGSCCESCHEDADMGYGDLLWGTYKGRQYWVCCAMGRALVAQAASTAGTD